MTATAACLPVSWLRLERYALGELASGDRAEIAQHLATCARCRDCAARIAADARDLPPLPAAAAASTSGAADFPPALPPPRGRRTWLRRRNALGFAAAAALCAFVVLRPGAPPLRPGPRVIAVKGGDVTLELVRERDGSTAWEPTSFAPGDHFKLLITCAPPLRLHADLVVVQGDGPAFPGPPALIACGNRVPLPPAFRITGPGPATICAAFDPAGPPSRAALAAGDGAPPGGRACLYLDRAD